MVHWKNKGWNVSENRDSNSTVSQISGSNKLSASVLLHSTHGIPFKIFY